MAVYDTFLKSRQQISTNQVNTSSVYEKFLAEKNKPAEVSPVGIEATDILKGVETAFPSTAGKLKQIGGEIISGYVPTFNDVKQAPEKVVGTIVNSIQREKKNIQNYWETAASKAPISEKVSAGLKMWTGAAQVLFSPISAFFAGAEQIPGLRAVSQLITLPFDITGDIGGDTARTALNALPIPQKDKDNLEEAVNEIGTLAGQIALGGKIIKEISPVVKERLVGKYGEKGADVIIKKATEKAKITDIKPPKKIAKPEIKPEIKPEVKPVEVKPAPKIAPEAPIKPVEALKAEKGIIGYHGTSGKFEEFLLFNKVPAEFKDVSGQHTFGTYFSDNKKLAGQFGENIMERQLDIQKPLNLSGIKSFDELVNKLGLNTEKNSWELRNMKSVSYYNKFIAGGGESPYRALEDLNGKFNIVNKLKKQGYDGMIFDDIENGVKGKTIVVFDVSKIKTISKGIISQEILSNKFSKEFTFDEFRGAIGEKPNIKQLWDNFQQYKSDALSPAEHFESWMANTNLKTAKQIIKEVKPTKISAKAEAVKPLEPIGEGKVKVSGLAKGVEAKAVEKKLTDTLGDLPEYRQLNMKEQAKMATDLVAQDFERAKSIAKGEMLPPKDLLPESVFMAVEDYAIKNGDIELLRELATSPLTTEATAMGQRIRALAERNPDTAVAKMQEIIKIKEEKVAKKYKKPAKEVKSEITKKIKESIKTADKWDWNNFIKSIQC